MVLWLGWFLGRAVGLRLSSRLLFVASLELLQRVFGSEAGKKISGERVTYRSHPRPIALLPVVRTVCPEFPTCDIGARDKPIKLPREQPPMPSEVCQ